MGGLYLPNAPSKLAEGFIARNDVRPDRRAAPSGYPICLAYAVFSTHFFTTETLGYVADCWHRIPENALPYATWNNTSIVSASHQRAEGLLADTEIGRDPSTYWYPTLILSLEIKSLLPPGGVQWLFVRAQVKEVKHGRMDAEVMVFDQGMGLVALSHQTCLVIENTEKQRLSKGKL